MKSQQLKQVLRVGQAWIIIPAILLGSAAARAAGPDSSPPVRSVFSLPGLRAQDTAYEMELSRLMRAGHYAEAETLAEKLIALAPEFPTGYYILACTQASQGKTEAALENLNRSAQHGFNLAQLAEKEPSLSSLRKHADWQKTLRAMATAAPFKPEVRQGTPLLVTNRVARVMESNTAFNGNAGVLQSLFVFPDNGGKDRLPVSGQGQAGDSICRWYKEGTAAGLYGDLYDNRDGRHSALNLNSYPQLTPVEYAPEAATNGISRGLQTQLFCNRITIGNASLANVAGAGWRSMPRLAYPDGRAMMLLYFQYAGNHLYIYPEHNDYDPGHNGQGGGHGDVFCGNSPYVLISQGSSGSDQAFLNTVACTLAAFRPDVKEFLATRGALMPAVQMLLRSSYKPAATNEDYLTGKAHPVVFDGSKLDTARMVQRAHDMTLSVLPPQIALKVMDEDKAVAGQDYFSPRASEILYETPAAIGRVVRSTQYEHRMVVSAGESRDFMDKPLTYQWRVLRGNASRIQIKSINKSGSMVELTVPYHERFAAEPGSAMEGNRVDIGAFVHNGTYYSAPAFVSFFYLDNEKRVYGPKQEILSVQYSGGSTPGNYVDPMVDTPKDWLDVYHYDGTGRLTGWTRTLNGEKQDFTAEGKLIVARDASGTPTETKAVGYGVKPISKDKFIVDTIIAR
jgi:hypothetical protein